MREEAKPGRPRQFEEERTLEKIMNIFWERGYEGTSLSDIVKGTGLKKGSLYAAFGDKHAMYVASLTLYVRVAVDSTCEMLTGPGDPQRRIHDFLNSPILAATDKRDFRGCFLCNASADKALMDTDTALVVRSGFTRMHDAIAAALGEADSSDPDGIAGKASMILSIYSGMCLMVKAGYDIKRLEETRDQTLKQVGLLA